MLSSLQNPSYSYFQGLLTTIEISLRNPGYYLLEEGSNMSWQWLPSLSLYLKVHSIYMQGIMAQWLRPTTLDQEVLDPGLGCHGVVLFPWARHFTRMCTLLTRSEWVPGWTVIACVLNSFQCCDGSKGYMLPRELSRYWNEQVPLLGNNCENNCYSACGCKLSTNLYKKSLPKHHDY